MSKHYHLEVQANPQKMAQKIDAIFSIYGKNGIIPWHIFKILTVAFRGRWGWMTIDVEFWGYDLEILQSFLTLFLLTSKW